MPGYICYVHPVDGLPRARPITDFNEAGMVVATLKAMNVDLELDVDLDAMKQSPLPVLCSVWDPNTVHNLWIHGDTAKAKEEIG